jgi:redox-sensitive bicupin YhaK (pirin superfamily)
MIAIRRHGERWHEQHRTQEAWLTFDQRQPGGPLEKGFGCLELLVEHRLPPNANMGHAHQDAEILTYVREGALICEDSTGRPGVMQAGEFQQITARRGGSHVETNASRVEWAHAFQIWLRSPEDGLPSRHTQKRFSTAERRGVLCVVASPDARQGSLRIHQDAVMCSAIIDNGQHLVHELSLGRSAWIHVVKGEVILDDIVLGTGDGAGISAERAVSFTARGQTEVLLVDVREAVIADIAVGAPASAPSN